MDAVNRKYIPDGLNTIDRTSRFEHRFLVLRKLGQGTYGKVQLALNKETNEEVAVKTIKKAKIENDEDMLRIRREIHIMTSLRHPHIVHIHEVFESRQKIVIVMQYASGGELYDYLGCHQILPEDEARRIFRQIASAIYYCHKNQICHRDLKLENILLDEEGNAKIADFGLSNVFDDHHTMNTFCGSPLYASPEIVKGTPYKGPEVDCWSMGVLLYTLVYGTMPFDGRSFKELVTQISEGRYEEPVHKSNASSLIRWLLTPDISKRATIKDVCNDKWVNKGYDTSLLEVAENMALLTRLHREKILSTKRSLETTTKNEKEKSIFKKAAEHLEEKAGKFTSLFTKNFEVNGKRNNAGPETQKPSFYEQITNYDVQFVLNKLITAVESSIKAEKNLQNLKNSESSMASTCNALNKEEHPTEKTDSAYIIPIFEVTSTIPKDMNKNLFIIGKNTGNISNNFKIPRQERIQKENSGIAVHLKEKLDNAKKCCDTTKDRSRNLSKTDMAHNNKTSSNPNQKNSLNTSNQPVSNKANYQIGTHDQAFSHHSFRRSKRINDSIPVGQKPPGSFLRTKNHVLSLARLLSLNYEKIIRNSFRMPACKKKLPGKITIPPTFDPNNPPTSKKQVEEKKELLIFPTVSVSENKEKIQKKIEKIKNAALNKNIIIRSDSKTRMRIEQYIRSQVKKIQDLVLEEQRSLQASLEHLDEQSLRDMSELYYRAFGSENTDSGIANTEEEDYFCFICSKPNNEKAMNGMVSSINLENIRRGSLYTSNHLHIPKGKELNKWGYVSRNFNTELGSLNRCKSEIHFPIEYLDYISTNKSDLSKRTNPQQQIQKNQIGNTQFFSAVSSVKQQNNANYRLLRSASDSIGLDFSKNAFDVIELNSDSTNFQNYKTNPHFLEQITSNECKFYETTDYDIQSCATDATFMNRSQILENDDGIGDSNDSFQSYIENLDSNTEHVITRSMSEHSCMNFSKANSNNASLFTKLSSDLHLKSKHESELGNYQRLKNRTDTTDTFDSESWLSTIENENDNIENKGKNKGLRRRNTMSCLRRDSETEIVDPNSSEFESYLWNAYKEHLLENQTNSNCSSSPNMDYYSLDRKTNFKHLDTERIDDINGFSTYDYMSKLFPNSSTLEQIRGDDNSPVLKNILKHSKVSHQRNSGSRLNRTKSVCPELLSGSDRDDQIRRLKEEQRFWGENTIFDQNEGKNHSITSNILNDIKKDRGRKTPKCLNRRRYPSNTLSPGKSPEYKKSFLQLLALKRIQEAEKELDKSNSSNLAPLEENPGSLLEALKTHGYKSVISQRFQDTNDDEYLDSFYTRYLKSPRNLRAELARLNHMYYQSLPRYMLGTYDENIFFDDTDYNGSFLNDLGTASYYESETPTYSDMLPDFKHQSRQCVYDWLDSTQVDEYLNSLRPDSLNIPDEIPFQTTSDTRKCCTQWGRENFRSLDEESTSDSQSTIEEPPSNSKYSTYQKNKEQTIPIETNFRNTERFQPSSLDMNDEREESVQDRIWRKSFYPRFNNRHLSRKGRSSLVELELPENRLGLLNNLYNSNLKTGYDKPLYTQGNRSNTSFHSIRSKKHSQSQNKFDSRSSMKKLYAKPSKEHLIQHDNQESTSDNARELYNTNENEEPEH